ncbi:MAG TPA: hypothetical protein VFE61_09245 [Candidatus Sulfotelmatobacter sp.]|nr:hypothetical protein [Candidatus Sulfotelmatobacter sp.]
MPSREYPAEYFDLGLIEPGLIESGLILRPRANAQTESGQHDEERFVHWNSTM